MEMRKRGRAGKGLALPFFFLAVEVEGERVFGLVLVTVKRIGVRQKKPRHGFCVLKPTMLVWLCVVDQNPWPRSPSQLGNRVRLIGG